MTFWSVRWLAILAAALSLGRQAGSAEAGHDHEPAHGGHDHEDRDHGSHGGHGHKRADHDHAPRHGGGTSGHSHEDHGSHRSHGRHEEPISSWMQRLQQGLKFEKQPWWFWAYASAVVMSAISFAGVALLVFLQIPRLGAVVEYSCLAFAATVLVADALIHLLPHALEGADHGAMSSVGISATVGCLAILAVPEVIEWHHHRHDGAHGHGPQVHAYGWANLVTEMLHNFVDGISLGLSWMAGPAAGVSTTIAVAVHELPQEIGDFMVLRSAGFPTGQLLCWNFLASLTCAGGVGLVHWLGETDLAAPVQRYMTAFTAGTFLSLALNMIFPQVLESIRSSHQGRAAGWAKVLCSALAVLAVYVLLRIGELEDHDHGHGSDHGHGGHGGHGHSGHHEL